ncbi:MAG: XdhC family protein [Rhodobacteraceae bacterium]|nr:XdhC family protein [Paracoccaceae bacterium]
MTVQAQSHPSGSVPEQALTWYRDGGAVLATVIRTWGSAPRPVGSQAAIGASGALAGSVSGGCVEGAIIAEASGVIETGEPRIFEFGVSDDDAFAVGLACGGQISVMVEPVGSPPGLSVAILEQLIACREARQPVALLTNTRTWERRVLERSEHQSETGQDEPAADLHAHLRSDSSTREGDWFVHVFSPPLRLMIVGAVHIAQPLVTMAELCGYEVTVIDPREMFATRERFPDVAIHTEWPDDVLSVLQPDSRTALVTLTHDPKIDDAALLCGLGTDLFYIGSLGSRRTHARRLERLRQCGADNNALQRIHAPIGLDIGAATPAEIALAVLAEITHTLRHGDDDG